MMNLKTAFFTALLSVALASPAVADTSRGGNSHHRNSSGISISFGHGLKALHKKAPRQKALQQESFKTQSKSPLKKITSKT